MTSEGFQFGEVLQITDKAINGLATPMVIVMPDAQSGQKDILTALTERNMKASEELIP